MANSVANWPLTLPLSANSVVAGASTSQEVPGLLDCAIAGRPYMIDWRSADTAYRHDSVPLLRTQADTGSVVGEQSLNPEGPWRRTLDSFNGGAGQAHRDQSTSVPNRFRQSYGVDVWTEGQLTLLPATEQSLSSASANLPLVVAGSRLYVGDGQVLKYTTDPFAGTPTYTTVTGTPAADIVDLTSDGRNVYVSYGASGIYETDTSTNAATQWVSGTTDCVDWVLGRFMASSGNSIYNVTKAVGSGAAALPSSIFDHRNTSFTFVCFAETLDHIYAGGYSGDKSEIYRISIEADGTALAAPTMAGRLPDGEVISSLYGYLGFILIGTTKGVRFAVPDANGYLQVGALLEIGVNVECFEGQNRFAWFGWPASADTGGGLGRLDLTSITDNAKLTPAYATDLLTTSTAAVKAVVTFGDKRVFTVAGEGVYVESDDKSIFGYLDTGLISYGLTEEKTAHDVLVTADFNDGGFLQTKIRSDENEYVTLGTTTTPGTSKLSANESAGDRHEIQLVLARSATDATKSPTLFSSTLRVYPQVETTNFITATLLLRGDTRQINGSPYLVRFNEEREILESLKRDQVIVKFQRGGQSWTVLVSDLSARGEQSPNSSTEEVGVIEVRMKVVA